MAKHLPDCSVTCVHGELPGAERAAGAARLTASGASDHVSFSSSLTAVLNLGPRCLFPGLRRRENVEFARWDAGVGVFAPFDVFNSLTGTTS